MNQAVHIPQRAAAEQQPERERLERGQRGQRELPKIAKAKGERRLARHATHDATTGYRAIDLVSLFFPLRTACHRRLLS